MVSVLVAVLGLVAGAGFVVSLHALGVGSDGLDETDAVRARLKEPGEVRTRLGRIVSLIRKAPGDRQTERTRRFDELGAQMPVASRAQVSVRRSHALRAALLFGVGLIGWRLTGWPVGGFLAAAAAFGLPVLLGRTKGALVADRLEAVATWTELLRDALSTAAGLTQAIVATAPLVPEALRPQASRLAERVSSGVPLRRALAGFAEELGDGTADLVVAALSLAAEARAQRLSELLSSLAQSAREQVAMRLRIEATRSSARSAVRTVVVFSIAFAAALMMLERAYLQPFSTPLGQFMLAVIGACYGLGLWLMVVIARPPEEPRLLASSPLPTKRSGGMW
jgi:tight adherence protein B